jgi:hypothetical protein
MSAAHSSTGPRTPEGKARSSQNALKHGFTSKNTIIPEGMEQEFDTLVEGLVKSVRPEGALEQILFKQLVNNAWKLQRIEMRQAEMAADGRDPLTDPDADKEFERLERYVARYQSAFRSTLREIRSLQTSRYLQMAIPDPLGPGSFPATVKTTEIIQLAKRTGQWFENLGIRGLIAQTGRHNLKAKEKTEPDADKIPSVQPISHTDFLTPEEKARLKK